MIFNSFPCMKSVPLHIRRSQPADKLPKNALSAKMHGYPSWDHPFPIATQHALPAKICQLCDVTSIPECIMLWALQIRNAKRIPRSKYSSLTVTLYTTVLLDYCAFFSSHCMEMIQWFIAQLCCEFIRTIEYAYQPFLNFCRVLSRGSFCPKPFHFPPSPPPNSSTSPWNNSASIVLKGQQSHHFPVPILSSLQNHSAHAWKCELVAI